MADKPTDAKDAHSTHSVQGAGQPNVQKPFNSPAPQPVKTQHAPPPSNDGMRSTADIDKEAAAPRLDTTQDPPKTKEQLDIERRNDAAKAAEAVSATLHENDAQRNARMNAASGKKTEEPAERSRVLRAIGSNGNVMKAESWPLKRDPTEDEKDRFLKGTRGAHRVDIADAQTS